MQVLSIVSKLLECALTGKMENHKAEVYYQDLGHFIQVYRDLILLSYMGYIFHLNENIYS